MCVHFCVVCMCFRNGILCRVRRRFVMIYQEFGTIEAQRKCMQLYSSRRYKQLVQCQGPLVEVEEGGDKEEGGNSIC